MRKKITVYSISLGLTVLVLATVSIWLVRARHSSVEASPPMMQTAAPNTLNWTHYGNELNNQRFQNVDQINLTNVNTLKVAWVFHTGVLDDLGSLQASPIVIDGTMYVSDGHDDVFALNAATGAQKWAYKPLNTGDLPPLHTLPICCGHNNRGVAVGDGKVFIGLLNNLVVALDQSTGAPVWKQSIANPANGYSITMAPQFVTTAAHPDGLLVISLSGGEFLGRGQVFALNVNTGATIWRTFTTTGPAGWGGNAFLTGGGLVWNTPALDTNLNLVIFNTGNPTRDVSGEMRPGNNPFTDSIVALDLDTGAVKWNFQEVHHDIWDYDAAQDVVLFDVVQNGTSIPAVGHCGKTAQYYILNRATGVPIFPAPERSVPTNSNFQNPSPTQPFSTVEAVAPLGFVKPNETGIPSAPSYTPPGPTTTLQVPGAQGGCEWPAAAFSPRTHFVYYPARYEPSAFHSVPNNTLQTHITGQDPFATLGSTLTPFGTPAPTGTNAFGIYGATNVNTGTVAWRNNVPQPATSGMAVGGDVVFYGETNGEFHAANAATGQQLFTFNGPNQVTNAGGAAAGPAIYVVGGKEFVVNAFGGNVTDRVNYPPSPVGDAIIAFSLP